MARPIEETRRERAEQIVLADATRAPEDRWRPAHDTLPEMTIAVTEARERLAWQVMQARAAHGARAEACLEIVNAHNATAPAEQHRTVPAWVRGALSLSEKG